jgi:hypothetical protein
VQLVVRFGRLSKRDQMAIRPFEQSLECAGWTCNVGG